MGKYPNIKDDNFYDKINKTFNDYKIKKKIKHMMTIVFQKNILYNYHNNLFLIL